MAQYSRNDVPGHLQSLYNDIGNVMLDPLGATGAIKCRSCGATGVRIVFHEDSCVLQRLFRFINEYAQLLEGRRAATAENHVTHAAFARDGALRTLENLMLETCVVGVEHGDPRTIIRCGRCQQEDMNGIIMHTEWCPFNVFVRLPL